MDMDVFVEVSRPSKWAVASIESIFDSCKADFCMARDPTHTPNAPMGNVGIMVLKPSLARFRHMLTSVATTRDTYRFPEQEWLTRYLIDPRNNFRGGLLPHNFNTCSLEVNGSHRWPTATKAKYFRTVQPYQHHSSIPRNFIYMYAFGLHPESASPSGALNITRLSSMTLSLSFTQARTSIALGGLTVFAWVRAYNVLRYRKGSAGLQYGATV
jgi:hypothetical protein